jgi:hypothetical protein
MLIIPLIKTTPLPIAQEERGLALDDKAITALEQSANETKMPSAEQQASFDRAMPIRMQTVPTRKQLPPTPSADDYSRGKAIVRPIQFAPRAERMGLGAEFAKPKNNGGPKR